MKKFNLKYLPMKVTHFGISSYRYHATEENYIITYWSRKEAELAQQQAAVWYGRIGANCKTQLHLPMKYQSAHLYYYHVLSIVLDCQSYHLLVIWLRFHSVTTATIESVKHAMELHCLCSFTESFNNTELHFYSSFVNQM